MALVLEHLLIRILEETCLSDLTGLWAAEHLNLLSLQKGPAGCPLGRSPYAEKLAKLRWGYPGWAGADLGECRNMAPFGCVYEQIRICKDRRSGSASTAGMCRTHLEQSIPWAKRGGMDAVGPNLVSPRRLC